MGKIWRTKSMATLTTTTVVSFKGNPKNSSNKLCHCCDRAKEAKRTLSHGPIQTATMGV
jgi:hypothetical protein